ncbi:MAG: aminoacetone oxidase family FAD-binding enzyme [bacterium]|nr:aminoacetone oxidase family FAD-binding enzyme [bacterium]
MKKIAVVGGGPAGMTAAVCAAGAGAKVTLYEGNDRVGKKILSTGNGRCNFSNERMGAQYYHGSGTALVEKILTRFGTDWTVSFLEKLGMRAKSRDGYLYPASDQASTVLDLLRYELDRLRIAVHTGERVTRITSRNGRFYIMRDKTPYDAVILACGGCAAPETGSDGNGFALAETFGHSIVAPVPALCALRCEERFYKQVAGVRCDARITLFVDGKKAASERGELQLTDYGLSGIPAFQVSRHAARALQEKKSVTARISFLPDFAEETCGAFFQERLAARQDDEMTVFLTGIVNKKINSLLLKRAGIRETERAGNVNPAVFEMLRRLYIGLETKIVATNGFERAQVCAGGVDCREVTESLMSKKMQGLYFAKKN